MRTAMINFHDILKQQDQEYGSLWSDEGVYSRAKEIQLLYPERFSNIFLGLGGFHNEKIIFGCIGEYLEISGIEKVSSETDCFGVDTVQSVISGTHYARAKEGLSLFNEALNNLIMDESFKATKWVDDIKAKLYRTVDGVISKTITQSD